MEKQLKRLEPGGEEKDMEGNNKETTTKTTNGDF
jgi:hypothetical protein